MKEGHVLVSSESEHHEFYRRSSLQGIKVLTMSLRDDTWYTTLIKRFNDWADDMKKDDLVLEKIELKHGGSNREIDGLQMLIVAIGRLKHPTRLFMNLFVPHMNFINFGNIKELYFDSSIIHISHFIEKVVNVLSLTRINKIGAYNGDHVSEFKDERSNAEDILMDPDNLLHGVPIFKRFYAKDVRQEKHIRTMYYNACTRFTLCGRRLKLPRDVIYTIIKKLSPKQWHFNQPDNPRWVEKVNFLYMYIVSCSKNISVEKDPVHRRVYEKELALHKSKLNEYAKRWKRDKFGVYSMGRRPPQKKFKK